MLNTLQTQGTLAKPQKMTFATCFSSQSVNCSCFPLTPLGTLIPLPPWKSSNCWEFCTCYSGTRFRFWYSFYQLNCSAMCDLIWLWFKSCQISSSFIFVAFFKCWKLALVCYLNSVIIKTHLTPHFFYVCYTKYYTRHLCFYYLKARNIERDKIGSDYKELKVFKCIIQTLKGKYLLKWNWHHILRFLKT